MARARFCRPTTPSAHSYALPRFFPLSVYTPAYDPDSNRIEWLWRSLRRAVTHTHTRETLAPLLEDADDWARTITPLEVLRQIGSPFADDLEPANDHSLVHAA